VTVTTITTTNEKKIIMVQNLIPFPGPDAEAHARTETERKLKLFAWADGVLQQLGLPAKVAQAMSFDELRKITFHADDVTVELAIRDALHPTDRKRAEHFAGMKAGTLKRLLKSRFDEMKKDRETQLRSGQGGRQSTSNWTDELKFDDKGGVRPILSNLILFLRHHPQWQDVLGFDEFNARVAIRKRPPWGEVKSDTHWTDHHESLTRVWFQHEDIVAGLGDVGRAVQAAARHNPFHPVREYLGALVWDRTSRLDTWLVTYFHAEDSAYIRAIGPRYLISAVARIYQPGCQADHMLLLEGPQGRLKSKALRTLAVRDAWFSDRLSHMASKDAAIEIAGVWLFELAELDVFMRTSTSTAKAFLTRPFDRFRPPHGKHIIHLLRQCVFAATINPPTGGYLKDTTGARRFWPVACNGMIDRDGIEQDRDQLWAEAVHRYNLGQPWWLETPELEALATVEQAARFKSDVWKGSIEKWLRKRKDTSVADVLQHVLGLAPREQNRSAQMRVADILTELGFTKHRSWEGGKAGPNRYRR
jgi:predicted P-loop ATPase